MTIQATPAMTTRYVCDKRCLALCGHCGDCSGRLGDLTCALLCVRRRQRTRRGLTQCTRTTRSLSRPSSPPTTASELSLTSSAASPWVVPSRSAPPVRIVCLHTCTSCCCSRQLTWAATGFSSWSGCTPFTGCQGCSIINATKEQFPIFHALLNAVHVQKATVRILTNNYNTPTCPGLVRPWCWLWP